MPSRDDFHSRKPSVNDWMEKDALASSVLEKQRETAPAARRRGTEQTVRSGLIETLAADLGKNPDELYARIPRDTVRRTKFPVNVERNADGTRTFKHPPQVVEGKALISSNRV